MSNTYIRDEADRRPHDPKTGLPRDLPGPHDLDTPLPVRNSGETVETVTVEREDGTRELRTKSGILLVEQRPARAWVKLAGEPALTLFESPEEFIGLWTDFCEHPERKALIVHDFAWGRPMAFFQGQPIGFVGITFPTTQPQNIGAGSVYTKSCECWRLGGRCPSP